MGAIRPINQKGKSFAREGGKKKNQAGEHYSRKHMIQGWRSAKENRFGGNQSGSEKKPNTTEKPERKPKKR